MVGIYKEKGAEESMERRDYLHGALLVLSYGVALVILSSLGFWSPSHFLTPLLGYAFGYWGARDLEKYLPGYGLTWRFPLLLLVFGLLGYYLGAVTFYQRLECVIPWGACSWILSAYTSSFPQSPFLPFLLFSLLGWVRAYDTSRRS